MPWTKQRLAQFRRTMKAKKQNSNGKPASNLPASFEAPLVEVLEHAREHASDAKLGQLADIIVAVWRRL